MDDDKLKQLVATASERTVDGLSVTGEAWRKNLGTDELLLLFATRRGAFLERQWVEYLTMTRGATEPLVDEALETLGRHVGHAQWLSMMSLKRRARGVGRDALVYYATGHAREALGRFVPTLLPYERYGRPAGKKLLNLHHTLLEVDALLYVLRFAEIHALLDEDTLRGRPALRELVRGARQKVEGDPATMADLLALISPRNDPEERLLVHYEVVNRCKAEHVARKPRGLIYFTDRRSMAETVRAVKGEGARVILLPDVYRQPEWRNNGGRAVSQSLIGRTPPDERSLLPRQRNVLAKLDQLAAASAEAVAAMLGQDRTGVCRVLSQLVKVGLLTTEDVRVDVLHGAGAPTRLYRRASAQVEAVRHLLLSWTVVLLAQRGFRAVSFDATTGILEVAHEESVSEQRALLWLDGGGLPFKRVMEEVRELQRRAMGEGAAAQLFAASDERVDDLRKMFGGRLPVVNISTAWRSFRQKSAEVREAADADVRRKRGTARKVRRRPRANSDGESARASAA